MRRSETEKTSRIKGKRSVPKKGTIVPKKGTGKVHPSLADSLFGETRKAILALFYGHVDESLYVRQIVRIVGAGIGIVHRELERLTNAGIINRENRGNQVHYSANKDCPIFEELRGLVVKTFGVADVLRAELVPLAKRIKAAFIYGSFANGTQNHASDVDVMVIGEVSFTEVVEALAPAQEKLRREINPTVYPPEEFGKKLAAGHHFLSSVIKGEKIFLVGSERELAGLA